MGDSQITTACTTPAEPADVSGSNAAQGSETTPSTSSNLLVVPEGKVLVWDKNMEQYVMKDKEDKKPKSLGSTLADGWVKFIGGGPPGVS